MTAAACLDVEAVEVFFLIVNWCKLQFENGWCNKKLTCLSHLGCLLLLARSFLSKTAKNLQVVTHLLLLGTVAVWEHRSTNRNRVESHVLVVDLFHFEILLRWSMRKRMKTWPTGNFQLAAQFNWPFEAFLFVSLSPQPGTSLSELLAPSTALEVIWDDSLPIWGTTSSRPISLQMLQGSGTLNLGTSRPITLIKDL